MIATSRPPLLKRLPPGVWVGAFWSALILTRTFQRPDEPSRLLRYHGNIEDAPLLVTAVVTTLGAFLLFRAPLAALAVALAGAVFSLGMDVRETPFVLFLLADAVVGYTAATRSRRVSVLASALPVAVVAGDALWRWGRGYLHNLSGPVLLASTVAIAWLIGNTVHQSRAHADTVREQATRQAVTAERLRIARELHDMVAHNIGIIAIQAGMGSRVMDTQPAETRGALEAIEAPAGRPSPVCGGCSVRCGAETRSPHRWTRSRGSARSGNWSRTRRRPG
ncbi:histidine kinase [Streptomyces sp. NPDC059874]|uniref:histidine kinase n=1 Tax=Streptomyces sp. NPDC059874 TaxID=3346983 RepID=UPI0036611218